MQLQNATAASVAVVANSTRSKKTHARLSPLRRFKSCVVVASSSSSSSSSLRRIFVVASSLLLLLLPSCAAVGYSYTRFAGPVAGPEQEVIVHDTYSGGPRVDYVAKPEYQFAYGVEDAKTRVLQNRKEERNGDAVTGVYSVVDPDGNLRVVKYTADNVNGFQAEVISNGVATLHGYNNNDNMKWYVQAGEPGQEHEVHHNSQPQQQQHEIEAEKSTKTDSSDDEDYDDDDDDSDGKSKESDDESGEDGADGEERDYNSSEEASREAHSDENYY